MPTEREVEAAWDALEEIIGPVYRNHKRDGMSAAISAAEGVRKGENTPPADERIVFGPSEPSVAMAESSLFTELRSIRATNNILSEQAHDHAALILQYQADTASLRALLAEAGEGMELARMWLVNWKIANFGGAEHEVAVEKQITLRDKIKKTLGK
jgi:hypothetical protein